MADVDHPKTHVEDQDLSAARKQPESPKHEGIDPLTEGDTMYPASQTRSESEKKSLEEANTPPVTDESDPAAHTAKSSKPSKDVATESTENVKKDGSGKADSVNTDGKLPTDAKVANKVSNDKQNTSPSNKPATQAEAGTDGTKTPDAAKAK